MLHTPNPDLNEEERALLGDAPEDCLQRAVRRGALSIDRITERLSPRAAVVVRSMVAAERPPSSAQTPNAQITEAVERPSVGAMLHRFISDEPEAETSTREAPSPLESGSADRPQREEDHDVRWQATYRSLGAWPSLQQAVDERKLTADEAMEMARTIDHILGRYTTGTRYAAP